MRGLSGGSTATNAGAEGLVVRLRGGASAAGVACGDSRNLTPYLLWICGTSGHLLNGDIWLGRRERRGSWRSGAVTIEGEEGGGKS